MALTLSVIGCTSTSDPRNEIEPAPIPPVAQLEPALPPPRCNEAVPDAESAIRLAEDAMRAAGFPDYIPARDKDVLAEGFRVSVMVPLGWPHTGCAVLFYVYIATVPTFELTSGYRGPLVARITVKLHDGTVETKIFEESEVIQISRILSNFGAGSLNPAFQQPLFEAVVDGTGALSDETLDMYREWLRLEPCMATALYIWHRAFFDALFANDPKVRKNIESEASRWQNRHGEGTLGN